MPAGRRPDRASVLRAMDRFHPIPQRPEFAASWAEWLYFNGRSRRRPGALLPDVHGRACGGRRAGGRRACGCSSIATGATTSYSAGEVVDEAEVLAGAPDLDIAGSHVRLEGLQYRIDARAARRIGHAACSTPRPASRCRRRRSPARAAGSPATPRRCCRDVSTAASPSARDQVRAARRGRLSRSQLGVLERRALAMGTGRERRSVDRLRPDLSAA